VTKTSTGWEQIRYTYCRRSQVGRNAQKEGANIGSLPFSRLFSSLWFATLGGPLKEQYGSAIWSGSSTNPKEKLIRAGPGRSAGTRYDGLGKLWTIPSCGVGRYFTGPATSLSSNTPYVTREENIPPLYRSRCAKRRAQSGVQWSVCSCHGRIVGG
jgi:hypothetical protein